MVKNPSDNVGDTRDADSIPGSGKSPGEGNYNSPQYSCLGNPMKQRNLVGYSPCSHTDSDMTEHPCSSLSKLKLGRNFSKITA